MEKENEQNGFDLRRLLIAVFMVLLTALFVGGGVWFFMDEQANVQKDQHDRQISELQKRLNESSGSGTADVKSGWKIYDDPKERFTINYPSTWAYKTNVGADDSDLGSNVFSADNVIFYDSNKNLAIGLNVGELFGRGGACTKRSVVYVGSVAGGKLSITKESDETKAVSTDEYCGVGEVQNGFRATVKSFAHNGLSFFFHSENGGATDAQSTEVIDIFEKMAATLTFS